eukprot:TRINITY_DN16535_c0_g1_i1.p1 TRINITY_DN16535_c0_g1~~TRINITY_DN16535_c0_g1_i1.p1  ORF type:complete len:144 (-),score=4.36 TRINITY_DN16535_c0_g1_i1:160-591(-)
MPLQDVLSGGILMYWYHVDHHNQNLIRLDLELPIDQKITISVPRIFMYEMCRLSKLGFDPDFLKYKKDWTSDDFEEYVAYYMQAVYIVHSRLSESYSLATLFPSFMELDNSTIRILLLTPWIALNHHPTLWKAQSHHPIVRVA